MKFFISILSFFLFIHLSTVSAQDKANSVKELVSTLKQKVLLDDDQTSSVEKVLNDLITKSKSVEDKNSLVEDAKKKVESYLDKRQKMKYDIIKNDWWKQVQTLL